MCVLCVCADKGREWGRMPFKHSAPFLFLAHTICPMWFGRVPAHTVPQGPTLMLSPLSPSCTIWHTWPSCSPLDMVMTATLCFGLECHLSPPLNSLLVRTNHLTCGRWECIMAPCALKEKETACVCTFWVFTQTMLLLPTEKWVKGLACCLIPSILGIEKKTCLCSEPHYTRPRGLFVMYRRKCHHMQGTVNLGNLHWKSVREKPLLNEIKINLWAVGLQRDDWDYLPDLRGRLRPLVRCFLVWQMQSNVRWCEGNFSLVSRIVSPY